MFCPCVQLLQWNLRGLDGGKDGFLDSDGDTIHCVGQCREIGTDLDGIAGISHGDACSRQLDHGDIRYAIADRDHLFARDFQ